MNDYTTKYSLNSKIVSSNKISSRIYRHVLEYIAFHYSKIVKYMSIKSLVLPGPIIG